MVKRTILVRGITEKQGKTGQIYFIIDTDKGTMSCFPDYKGLEALRDAWKADDVIEVNVETSEDGKFQNIRNERKRPYDTPAKQERYDKDSEQYDNMQFVKPKDFGYPDKNKTMGTERKSVSGSAYEKDPVGLAVEVFCAIYKQYKGDLNNNSIMDTAIGLVKQAQKGFS